MNSVLFTVVTALALYQVFGCEVYLGDVSTEYPPEEINVKNSGNDVYIDINIELKELALSVSYLEDNEWQVYMSDVDLCENGPVTAIFKKIFLYAFGFRNCTLSDRIYGVDNISYYFKKVCSEIKEKTINESKIKLKMKLMSGEKTVLDARLYVTDY